MKQFKISNFVIIILVAAAVFQTGRLWLEDNASHNLFYSAFAALGNEYSAYEKDLKPIQPEKIIIGYGNKKFDIQYPGESGDYIFQRTTEILSDIIKSGSFETVSAIDWNSYIEGRAVIMSYSFSVSAKEFTKGLGTPGSDVSTRIKNFDGIVLLPEKSSSNKMKCYFVDSTLGEAYMYRAGDVISGTKLYSDMDKLYQASDSRLSYISTKQSGFNIFENVFVPQWGQNGYNYAAVDATNPFVINGKTDEELLEKGMDGFFQNFATKWSNKESNGTYTFSDENTVVKYYPKGVLEYYNYASVDVKNEQTLSSAYTACMNFMKNDISLQNNVYFSGVEIRSDGLVFYFDYTIDNMPVLISEELKASAEVSHGIEVIVKDNVVKKYKRYVSIFQMQSVKSETATKDMLSALDAAMTQHYGANSKVTSVTDMKLGYYLDGNESIYLKWFTQFGGAPSAVVGDTQ